MEAGNLQKDLPGTGNLQKDLPGTGNLQKDLLGVDSRQKDLLETSSFQTKVVGNSTVVALNFVGAYDPKQNEPNLVFSKERTSVREFAIHDRLPLGCWWR